ncbi:MAG TPA: hypothetical protein VFV22_03275 [Candidatus Paceibacterota bacterium]|nr:hypothetical protein [Candidatus Paceibacterota bacterium]
MKIIKILLGVIVVLLSVGIGLGVYVWYTIQKLEEVTPQSTVEHRDVVGGDASSTVSQSAVTKNADESITIETSTLTSSQQAILNSFGVKGDHITVTKDMITCAEDAVSSSRFNEIINGAAPTPLEGIKLMPCFK